MRCRDRPPSDRDGRLGDFSEGSRKDLARLRLPARELRAKRIVSVVEHVADLGCVSDSDDELQLLRAETPQLLDRRRNSRLRDMLLANSTEPLAEQSLDRLDPRSVIGDGDLLSEALAAFGAGAGRPGSRAVLVAAQGGRGGSSRPSSAAVWASAGRTADGELGAPAFRSNGSDSTITGSRCRAFRVFAWSPFATTSDPSSAARAAWYAQNSASFATERHGSPFEALRSRALRS